MSRLVATAGTIVGKRPILMLGDFTPGDTPSIERNIENVPTGKFIAQAWMTWKATQADADPGVLQLAIDGTVTAGGQIYDSGADGVAALRFTPTAAQTLTILALDGLFYDISVALNDGTNYTIETGRFYPWLPPLNPWEGLRGSPGLIRVISAEPLEGQPRRYENELVDDVVGGDDYELRRLVYGLEAGRTVTAASLTAVASAGAVDPGLFKIDILPALTAGGKIEDQGSGAPRRADLRFVITRAQTALLTIARGFRVRVTLDNGKLYTVLRGTMFAREDVTDTVGAGAVVATVTVTPDPFSIEIGQTQQMTAVARDSGGTIIPGATFTWLSSAPAVATVDAAGLVTSLTGGTTNIRATAISNGVFDEAAGTVTLPLAQQLPQTGLVNVWYANAGSGQILEDSAGADDLTLGTTAGADSADPSWQAGPPKSLLYVNDDQVAGPVAAHLRGPFTFVLVTRINTLDDTTRYFFVQGPSTPQIGIVSYGPGDKKFRFYDGVHGATEPLSGHSIVAGDWLVLFVISPFGTSNDWEVILNKAQVHRAQLIAWGQLDDDATPTIMLGLQGSLDQNIGALIRYSRAISHTPIAGSEVETIYDILRSFFPGLPA